MTDRKTLLALAKLGAQARMADLKEELGQLEKLTLEPITRTYKKRRMSSAKRKALSVRMTKYWADRKRKTQKPRQAAKA